MIIISLVFAAGALALGIYWMETNSPDAKELDYREKEELATRNASSAIDMAHESSTNAAMAVAKMSEYQSASEEVKQYGNLADLEMNQRILRSQRLAGAAAVLGLLSIATAAMLFLPDREE
jgi:hypothetical protein